MLDAKNVVTLTGGVVADPELINDKIAKIRIAIDYAGAEKDSENNSGYFDVTYYLRSGTEFINKNAGFLHSQITSGKMKKGSQIQLIGRLVQERWQKDGSNNQKVVIVAETISYATSNAPKTATAATATSSTTKDGDGDQSPKEEYNLVPSQF